MGAEKNFALPDATWNVVEGGLPKKRTLVKYRTAVYQMFGYVDGTGRWVGSDGNEEPMPVESWTTIHQPLSPWPERVS